MDFNQYVKDLGLVIQQDQTTTTTADATISASGTNETILAVEVYNRDKTINQLISVDGGSTHHEVLPQSSIWLPVSGVVKIKSASGTPAYEIRVGVRP